MRVDAVRLSIGGVPALLIGLRMAPASSSDLSQLLMGWASLDLAMRLEYLNSTALTVIAAIYLRNRVPDVILPRTIEILLLTPMELFVRP